ncbi:hypothetical protein C900_01951 [Fulvivirga imtechensis AK7]|uniref:Uncharacterized protein n=1 Tax=Fulvivirga imtechensis AK7 TaxID=1237149 RepID=L8JSK8_9BACT|nr:hypothetical protein [Fulvivirga imtechensis]ELR71956.1 hypothetical protein C900_01951 [Fulvivirga imtechensis AK7]
MNLKDYKNIRETRKILASKILDFKKDKQSDIIYAGKQLGFLGWASYDI